MSISRHTAYNVAGAALPIAISLVLTPRLLSLIGVSRFGLLSIFLILLGYFGLFDLGTGRAVAQRIASLRQDSQESRNRAFWTSLSMCFGLCAVSIAVVAAAVPLVSSFLKIQDLRLALELHSALYWLVAAVPIAMLGSQFSGALEGRERFGFVNLVSVLTSGAALLLPLLAAIWISPTLQVLAAAATLGRLLGVVALAVGAVILLPVGRPSFDRQDGRKLLSFGGWVTISNIVGPIMVTFDRFLIGRLIGPSATGVYALPFSLMSQMQIIPAAVNRAIFPRMAAASAIDAPDGSEEVMSLLNFVLTWMLLLAAPLILPFFSWWVGAKIGSDASRVAYALMPGIWANSLAMVTATALAARANTRFLALVHLCEVIPYLFVLYAGINFLGLVGAALAWSARCISDAVVILWCQRAPLRKMPTGISGAGICAVSAISLLLPSTEVLRWILVIATGGLTLWQAWAFRPRIARTYAERVYGALRSTSSSR